MRNEVDITERDEITAMPGATAHARQVGELVSLLDRDGVVIMPTLVSGPTLKAMQVAFNARLQRMRWNNFDGYQRTELYRHMVEDVLTLEQGFIDLVLHPLVKDVLDRYLGDQYELTEAKGWKSLPTKRDFHGWHGDAWYDQTGLATIPGEVKLAIYLTDVRTGAFNYIKGSHRKQHPRLVKNNELHDINKSQIAELAGPAGTAFLFDTSGIHRQSVPVLEERRACFFNYHDPKVALQQEDVDYYRYHPLILNAAFLGGLTEEEQRILGFGNKTNFNPTYVRPLNPTNLYRALITVHSVELKLKSLRQRIAAKLHRMLA